LEKVSAIRTVIKKQEKVPAFGFYTKGINEVSKYRAVKISTNKA
jgi:hypothetical protein